MILSWSAKLRTQSSRVQEETFGQLLPFLFPLISANQAIVTLVCSKRQCLTRIPKTQLTAQILRSWFTTLHGHDECEAVSLNPTPDHFLIVTFGCHFPDQNMANS